MADDEDIISSISKGCFFFKPNEIPKSRKRKRKSLDNNQLSAANYQEIFNKENEDERRRRFDAYIACWEDLESQIKGVQDSLNESVFKDLLKYVQDAHINEKKSYTVTEIPTATLITGVNVPDHGVFFTEFVNILKESVTPFVAQLHSKDCSNLKFLIKTAFDSLVITAEDDDDDDDEDFVSDDDEVSPTKRHKKSSVFKEYTFTELKDWYQDYCLKNISTIYIENEDDAIENEDDAMDTDQGTSNIDPKIEGAVPPLVFIFEDFERFSSVVLQDFILICSEYTADIPIVLLFGVTTGVTTVHRLLPHFVSSKLSIQKFQSQPSLVCLTQVIDKVIITDRNAFKLGPHVFRLLYEHFLYHDFSINSFVRGLKFCVMEHFNGHATSVMCTKDSDDIHDYIIGCDMGKVRNIMDIHSFKRYIEKKSEQEQKRLENDTHLMQNEAVRLIKKLQRQEEIFYPMVKCLYTCTCKLPTHPLGKWQRDAYEYCSISSNITKDKRFYTAMTLLRMLSRDALLPILQSCENILNMSSTTKNNPLKSEAASMKEFVEKFSGLDNVAMEVVEEEEDKKQESKMPVYKSRYEFTEKLKMAVKEKKKETPYEKLRNSVVDYLESMFKKHLLSPLSMTGHEIFYYNDVRTVRQRLNGTPRIAIQKALTDPRYYLNCSCCKSGGDEIEGSMPDVCILYKLHLESGRLINLYDWLQAFICFIDPSIADEKKKKTEKKKKMEEQLQARFIRGISELQFLGFIKGTRRKTDHVSRLTWGGC